MESGNTKVADQLIYDYRTAELSVQEKALCEYAVKLTLIPGEMREEDVKQLHQHHFTDEQITIATQVVSYFNYINRIADGLGVDSESWMTLPKEEWNEKKGKEYHKTIRSHS